MDPVTTTLSQDLEARVDNLQERITGGLNDIQRQQTLIDSLVEANDRVGGRNFIKSTKKQEQQSFISCSRCREEW